MPLLLEDTWLPATLTAPPMTDEEFAAFCAEHSDLSFEMTASGDLIVMPPTYTETGIRNLEIGAQLQIWTRSDGRGRAADSSTGYVLPNGAQLGWLIDPSRRAVEIFRPGCDSEVRENVTNIAGEGPVAGFLLDLCP